jgi:cytochrome c biogenesis protein CcdA
MALLLLFILVRNRTETLVAGVATALPFGWAFAAGMVSSVNPCGFFLLPAYLSYQLGADDAAFHATSAPGRVLRGLVLGVVVTAGFVLVMGAIGAIIGTGGQAIVRALPYGGLAVGMILAAMGLWLLVTRRSIGIAAARRVAVTPRRNLRNVFFFGMAYAIGSLSCTLPIFLLVVGGAAASGGGFGASLGQFFSYALGMGSILLAVTMGAAVTRGGVARSLRRALPLVDRISALFLLGAGGYLVVYWLWGPGALL